MSYIKAIDVLPKELIDILQCYIDGEYLYIPRKEDNKKAWGENSKSKENTILRNMDIYRKYSGGMSIADLSKVYFLSPKSIQKIIAKAKATN